MSQKKCLRSAERTAAWAVAVELEHVPMCVTGSIHNCRRGQEKAKGQHMHLELSSPFRSAPPATLAPSMFH